MSSEDGQTRDNILDATLKLTRKQGIAAVTMAGVAKEAGVTRQTVYFYFGTRAGLMSQMMQRRFRVHPLSRRARELSEQPASIATFEEFVKVCLLFIDDVGTAAFAEWAQAAGDNEVLKAIRERCDDAVDMTQRMMGEMKQKGLLKEGWSAKAAAQWVNVQLYPTNYFALAVVQGWPVERIIQRTLTMLRRDLLAD
jgi:AcrR family transcriptional regulator